MPNHDEDEFPEEWDEEGQPLTAKEGEVTPAPWYCAGCGEANETQIDLSSGYDQEYVEDCTVCCRPNMITINIDPESLVISLRNELAYE